VAARTRPRREYGRRISTRVAYVVIVERSKPTEVGNGSHAHLTWVSVFLSSAAVLPSQSPNRGHSSFVLTPDATAKETGE
jgi:hypothetical protein